MRPLVPQRRKLRPRPTPSSSPTVQGCCMAGEHTANEQSKGGKASSFVRWCQLRANSRRWRGARSAISSLTNVTPHKSTYTGDGPSSKVMVYALFSTQRCVMPTLGMHGPQSVGHLPQVSPVFSFVPSHTLLPHFQQPDTQPFEMAQNWPLVPHCPWLLQHCPDGHIALLALGPHCAVAPSTRHDLATSTTSATPSAAQEANCRMKSSDSWDHPYYT